MPRLHPCLTGALTAMLVLLGPGCGGYTVVKDRDTSVQQTHSTAPVHLPGKHSFRLAPYVFLSDTDLKSEMALLRELATLRDQVYKELQLPTSTKEVYVYLFEDLKQFHAYWDEVYPKLPKRRAFFIAQERGPLGREDLMVFTALGERLQQDLRHELTHALLHSVLKNVPIWLDEGLAEYFELPPDRQGVNDAHLKHMRRSAVDPFKPDLARLEKLTKVEEMAPAEYREAWAWVHYMMRSTPENRSALLAYLQQLRATDKPGPMRPKLTAIAASPEEALIQHVHGIVPPPIRTPTAQR